MSVQDKMERILREMHIMISRGKVFPEDENFVLVHKKAMQKQLTTLSEVVREMMEIYEVTEESRDRADREAERNRMEMIRNANRQVEDIYAASVIYTDDALGRIQDIIGEAEAATRDILQNLSKEMEEEMRIVRSNQVELKTQLDDMKETGKYLRIIEERNKEIAKEKAKKKNEEKQSKYKGRKAIRTDKETDAEFAVLMPDIEIKINEEYFEKAGLTPDGLPIEMAEEEEDKITYEKPEIKINEEYFKKAGIEIEEDTHKENATEQASFAEMEVDTIEEAIDPEMEAKLKAELDMEYFKWQQGGDAAPKEKRRLFSFGKKDKS
ncbi:MAG: hypothetical protein J6A75_12390 [Lachnospiraceae bacterium]|nr:hypothetical protein [Lachnospiraceae bacterium]